MNEDEIYDIADAAAQSVLDRTPDRHLSRLDEEEREQLMIDLQNALADVLRQTLGDATEESAE